MSQKIFICVSTKISIIFTRSGLTHIDVIFFPVGQVSAWPTTEKKARKKSAVLSIPILPGEDKSFIYPVMISGHRVGNLPMVS
jgi:hypothetical protein